MTERSEEVENQGFYGRCYKGSVKTNITSYFNKYRRLIESSNFHKHYDVPEEEFILGAVGCDVDEERYKLLLDYCSVDNLTVDGELPKMNKNTFDWLKDPEEATLAKAAHLETVKHTLLRNKLQNHQKQLKYKSERPIIYEPVECEAQNQVLIPESDVLVLIRIYAPFTSRCKQSAGALGKLSVNLVVAMPGSQTLDKLRDVISCESDLSVSVEMSNAPVRQIVNNAKDVYKSGFFFIEDTFYNDFRDPKNKDNSTVIREWAASKNLGNYKTAKMEETRVDSLVTKFGFPWVYQHQGDCEHLISFSDARLVNPSDELKMNCYPRIVRIKPKSYRYCMTCGLYNVRWITTDNNRLPHNPCLFCDSCFKSYNYVRGKKIGSFQAFPYPYDCNLLEPQHKSKKCTKSNLVVVENTKTQEQEQSTNE